MQVGIWVTTWEQECCGPAFRVGSTREWLVRPDARTLVAYLGVIEAAGVTYSEDRHAESDDGLVTVVGTVVSIREVSHAQRLLGDRSWEAVPGDVLVHDVTEVLANDFDIGGELGEGVYGISADQAVPRQHYELSGWVVRLDHASIR